MFGFTAANYTVLETDGVSILTTAKRGTIDRDFDFIIETLDGTASSEGLLHRILCRLIDA